MESVTNGLKARVIRALVGSGFTVLEGRTRSNYFECYCERFDLFGVRVRYLVILTDQCLNGADAASIASRAKQDAIAPVIVSDVVQAEIFDGSPLLTVDQFTDRLGGPILSMLPFQPPFADRLGQLGVNVLPAGLVGEPDTLFEEYVHAGLQFLIGGRVIKYGQERLFEAVPDGVAINQGAPLLLYDAKAYKEGYEVTADAIRQFSDYVRSFHRKYEASLGRLTAFVVVSGKFADSELSLQDRSHNFLADSGISLSFLTAATLGEIVNILSGQPLFRRSINWAKILTRPTILAKDVSAQVKDLGKDAVQRGR
ncbi:MAG: hypothetical protein KIS66_06160 [Fimbriimonadaceae bacterium]|nr:hypothetical protein [Fimbriimonadaceae bacterium]